MTIAWLAIINPSAGHVHSARWQKSFAERVQNELNSEVVLTQYHGHATEIAQNAKTDGLAVFGGDGTVAEVVNGMDLDRQKLLLLGGGTGNGLARDLGLMSLDMAMAAANAERFRLLDLIHVTFRTSGQSHRRLAISTASVGYAAEVVVLANRYFKRLGSFCYPLSATLQAARQKVFPLKVSIDENKSLQRQLSNVMVNNTRHAGNFSAFRASNLSDGLMEVLLAKAGFASQFLHNLAVLSKTYFYETAAEITAHKIVVALTSPQRLMIDGEIWEDVVEVNFEVLPRKLQCVV
jgi:diacylglycerol kinase family enzyme